MTLADVIRTIELVARNQPAVNMIVRNDVFRINETPVLKYGVFAWLQRQHSTTAESPFINYAFTFFYVDRLTMNRSDEFDIQSVGMSVLGNVISSLEANGIYVNAQYSFQPFNQRFTDECAGVFVNVSFDVLKNSRCPEIFRCYADFDKSFNHDFLICRDDKGTYADFDISYNNDFLIF